jgi:hypothetical protein
VPKVAPPVTFITCLTGSELDRQRLLKTLAAAIRPSDHAFAIDANYGPAPSALASGLPSGLHLLRVADAPLPLTYDMVAKEAGHEHLIFLGTGCSVARPEMDRLRAALVGVAPGAVVMDPFRSSTNVDLNGRALIGISRSVLLTLGGMGIYENRARKVDAGFVGTGDLFEVMLHEVRRAGWRVEHVRQNAPYRESNQVQNAPVQAGAPEPVRQAGGRPSLRIPPELKAAVAPTAASTIGWFSTFLPEMQVKQLVALLGLEQHGQQVSETGWDHLAVARMLWWRGQRPYASYLLEQSDLTGYRESSHVADIFQILITGGSSPDDVLGKLSHVLPQLAAVLPPLPIEQTLPFVRHWWETSPGTPEVTAAVMSLSSQLSVSQAVEWHIRMSRVPSAHTPLGALAADEGRPLQERATASRFIELADPSRYDQGLGSMLALQAGPAMMASVYQAVNALLAEYAAAVN